MAVSRAHNIPLEVKQVFLRFAQAYFSTVPNFEWTYDIRTTNIIIADRNSADIGVAVRRPSIILSRGDLSWAYAVRGQDGFNSANHLKSNVGLKGLIKSTPTIDNANNKVYTDLMNGGIVFNVLSKNGVQAEQVADIIFSALTAYKDDFRKNDIFKFTGMSMGAERVIKQDSEVTLAAVPISISFVMQKTVTRDIIAHNLSVTSNSIPVYENADFTIITNGTQLQFHEVPDLDIVADYRDAITLQTVENATLVATANPLVFTIPDSGTILGYYEMLEAFELTMTEDEDADDYTGFEDQGVQV